MTLSWMMTTMNPVSLILLGCSRKKKGMDPQALNYFLHGPSSKSSNEDLTNAGYSVANSNSIFANSNNTDPKTSIKGVSNQLGEGPSDGLQLSSSLQFLEDELESSPLPDLSEDQPFDILQKSLQEANITEQTLAEEAYLDASIGSSQQFAQAQLHPSSSASFTQASNVSNYSGQTLQPIGVTQVVQQPVGTSFASNTVGVQHGFMQHVGISVPSQHLSNNNQISGSGQIQLIGSFSNQPSMMTINNLDGSQIILKGSGQQASANMSSGLLVHRQTPNASSSKSISTFSHTSVGVTQQQYPFGQAQKKIMNQTSPVSASKSQDSLRQPQLTSLLSNTLPGQDSGGKIIQQSLGAAQLQQEKGIGSSPIQQNIQVDGHTVGQKRPATKQLTKGAFILQQLQKDQAHSVTPDKSQFSSLNDAIQRLLSYHVYQGSLPTEEDLRKVDSEFESVATQLLKRTQAMLNKYRCLLLEDAMRINPSAEMVMIDRIFNQEERASLSRDKRLALVDPDGYQADFCCSAKQLDKTADEAQSSKSDHHQSSKTLTSQCQTTKMHVRDRPKSSTAESANHDKLHLVPNNIVTPQGGNNSTKKAESLTKALKFEKASCSPESQFMAVSEEKVVGKDLAKSSENSSSSEDLSKTLSRANHVSLLSGSQVSLRGIHSTILVPPC
ncbi:GLTSCR1-like protein isoform A [Alligator mississippiensis]|uniref:GLTSCR1-like protein isoform A n=1 Tax=Alligator mississippiensis TaxID=8496 RepID=A0A151P3W9_ALLMI|nr:GLTSCR1-like protein isoform A [Alligator mississippiensis]